MYSSTLHRRRCGVMLPQAMAIAAFTLPALSRTKQGRNFWVEQLGFFPLLVYIMCYKPRLSFSCQGIKSKSLLNRHNSSTSVRGLNCFILPILPDICKLWAAGDGSC